MMKNSRKSKLPVQLARGRKRFEQWRSKHKPHTRLPGHLWSLAVKLAGEYGLNRTAKTLRLDYNVLKKRMKTTAPPAIPTQSEPAFLQLLPSELTAAAECIIECENTRGTKLHIHIKGRELPDLAALSTALWSSH